MDSVRVSSHYGQSFDVEQCHRCGGMWFDTYEHLRLAPHEVGRLEALDGVALSKSVNVPANLLCPKDGTRLDTFQDINFPADIIVESCATCDGLWFNTGELREYADAKKRRHGSERRPRAALLARTFLDLHTNKEKGERDTTIQHAGQKEALLQFLARVMRPGLSGKLSLVLAPLWILIAMLYAASRTEDKLHVNMHEFKALLTEVENSFQPPV